MSDSNNLFSKILKESTKNNIIEPREKEEKVKVVKPKTTSDAYIDTLRSDPKGFGFGFALDLYNKNQIKKGNKPILTNELGPNETTAGREVQAAVVGAGGRIAGGIAEILTAGVDYAFDTNYTKKLDEISDEFLNEHGSPKTFMGDITRIGLQYGIPSTATLKLVNQIPKLANIGKSYKLFRASLSKIKNKFGRRTAKLGTSIARRSGQGGLALGAADALVAERGRQTMFVDKVSEEGKTGKDLAAARFKNKLRFGLEGGIIGVGFPLVGKALPVGFRYGIYKPLVGGFGKPGTFINKLTPVKIGAKVINATVVNPAARILSGSTRPAVDSFLTKIASKKGILSSMAQTSLKSGLTKPLSAVDLPGKFIVRPVAKGLNIAGNVITKELGTRILLPLVKGGGAALKQSVSGQLKNPTTWKSTLPEFSKWRTFSIESTKPMEAVLKRLDNKLRYMRSLDNQTGTQYALNTAARQEIKRAARRTEKLLKSLEVRSYKLAKAFEGRYNTGKTSPAGENYYLDNVLEFLKGQRTLASLPKELRVISQSLNKDLGQIKKTYADLLPPGELKEAVLGNLKGYLRKSFAIFENPGYEVPLTSPLFKKAQQFALNLINGKGGGQFRVEAKKVFGGPGVSEGRARELQAQAMIQQVLRIGKTDMVDPIKNLNAIARELKLKNFIATGEELPTVIKNLLGQENNLKSQVLTTVSSMVTQSTNKMLFDRLASVLQKSGILFKTEEAAKRAGIPNPVVVQGARGIGEMKTLLQSQKNPLYGASDLVEAITTQKGFMDGIIQNSVYKNILQLKTGVQYGKTVLSPETQVRNFYSAAMFPLARGLIGGRASVTDSIAMVADDIFRAGKGDAQAELRLLANIDEGIKYGVLDENIVASELAAVLKEVRNGKIGSVEGLAKFLEKNPFTETAARLYAGGDNVWKWYTYNWYKSFTKDLFKNDIKQARTWFKEIAGRDLMETTLQGGKVDIDEAIRQAASWYTRNTIPTYSKVPLLIQEMRRTPFGNFVSFPAEMLRTTFNNLNISMKEAASSNPELRAMGTRGILGLYTTLGAASYAVKGLYESMTGVSDDAMDLYKKYFGAPYQKNANIMAISPIVDGKFKAVTLSDFIPQSAVLEPIEAYFNTREEQKKNPQDTTDYALELMFNKSGPVMSFLESYISTPIGLEPLFDIKRGRTSNGKIIFSPTDSPSEKFEKRWKHVLRTLEPGIITSSRKLKNAFFKQPTPSGILRETGDVLVGASTGLKPFNVNIIEALDYKISEYASIRSNVFKGEKFYKFNDIYNRGGQVIVDEFIDIQREAFRQQKLIYDAIEAARAIGVSNKDLRKAFKARKGLSSSVIRNIMKGKFVPVTYSETLFNKKIDILNKREKEQNFDFGLSKRFIFPKSDMNRVIRKLKRDNLSDEFYYDKEDLRSEVPSNSIPTSGITNTSVAKQTPPPVQPLPPQPKAVAAAPITKPINPITGLTNTETALLSPTEQQIRINQRT